MKANRDLRLGDEQLLSLGRNDDDTISVLISRYMGFISDKARAMARIQADAEDLMQEGLLALLDAIRTYNSGFGTRFSSYAAVCITNRMKSAIARNNKKDIPALFVSEQLEGQSDLDDNPESILIAKEKAQEISEIIRKTLSPLERETLMMFLKGSTYDQMAEQLTTSRKSVDNALQRARRKLKCVFRSPFIHP